MFETVSVDEALAKGRRSVSYPAIFILIGLLIAACVASGMMESGWVIGGGVVVGFALAWLYWSFNVTKWRLWAFENVRNVHELKKRAIKDQLIWKDDSFFAKTEIRSADDQARWDALQSKFILPDIFNDDSTIPAETQIRYSKKTAVFQMVLGVILLCVGGYVVMQPRQQYICIILFIGGGALLIAGLRHYNNPKPQIILNNDGVSTADTPFFSWDDVTNEDTKVVHRGKSSRTYFIYNCPAGEKKVDLGELATGKRKLEKLLRIYRGRYEAKKIKTHG
jgi:hypothetical protein